MKRRQSEREKEGRKGRKWSEGEEYPRNPPSNLSFSRVARVMSLSLSRGIN